MPFWELDKLRFAPDEPLSADSPAPGLDPEPAADATATVVAPAIAEGAALQPAAPSPITGVREYAEQLGFQGMRDQFPDDGAFVQHLLTAERERQRLSQVEPYAQEYMQHAAAFRQWQTQQAAAQQQPAAPKKLFELPEWKPEWQALLSKDANGNVVAAPGADPAIVAKYHAYQHARNDLANRFLSDPESFLSPVVEQRVQGLLDSKIQERLGAYETRRVNEQYIAQNSQWLFAANEQGQQIVNPANGQPVLSPFGQRFVQHLQQAAKIGMNDQSQRVYAEAMVRNEMLAMQLSRLSPQDAGKQQVIDANRQPNRGPNGGPNGQVQNQSLSLGERLRLALKDHPEDSMQAI